nr:hypothetical protein [Tanacetum cinerariifolium]
MMSKDSSQINEVHSNDNYIFDNVNHQLAQKMHPEEHLGFDEEYDFLTNTIPYKKLSLISDAKNVSTEASAATSDQIAMIAILNNLISQRNAELLKENELLKSTLSAKDKSIEFLKSEKEKVLTDKKELVDSYLDAILSLRSANRVTKEMLQRFNMPTHTIPMLSKKPRRATADLHQDILERTTKKPLYVSVACLDYAKEFVEQQLTPFYEPFKKHIEAVDAIIRQEVAEYKKIFDDLDAEYEHHPVLKIQIPMMTDKDSSAAGLKPITPFIHTRPAESKIQATLMGLNNTFPFVEKIIKEYTRQRPIHIQEACSKHTKKCFEDRVIPFLDMFKIHVMHCEVTWFKEATKFNKIFDELDNAYAKCLADNQSLYAMNKRNIVKNKCLQIQKKNLLIHDESLIDDYIAKDVCSIVLASEREVFPRSNYRCEELQSTCDREHSRVLELKVKIAKKQQMLAKFKNQNSLIQKQFVDLQVKFQNYKECLCNQKVCEQPNTTASNAIFEINKLKARLQEKDDTIRHLHAEKDIIGLLNVGSTESSFETKALETKIAQLKDGLTSLKIQNDGYKVTNANLNKCYQELSKANTHLRTTSLYKIATQKAVIATLKAEAIGKKNSGPTGTPTKPKVLASGMYTKSSKYIPPQKRADWVQPTLLPKKKQVTFLEPHRTSPRSTQKPPVQHKKPTVPVNIQFVDRSTKSVHTKPHQAKRVVNTSTNAWNATKNTVARIIPIWKPTGRRFNLHDIFDLRTSTEPIVKPSELTPCVGPSTNATLSLEPILEPVELSPSVSSCASSTINMVSWFFDYRLIVRLVPMRYLASFTDEILVQRFNLHDIFGSRTSTEPIVKPSKLTLCVSPSTNATLSLEPILEPIELSPSVSSCASSTITMVSRFSDYRLSDHKECDLTECNMMLYCNTRILHFVLDLRFSVAFWLCVLLIEDNLAFCLDIQCAGFDTRPAMLDRTDFASWKQRIRLYCRGKENRVNILKSIDEGPYQMGAVRETLAESIEGAPPFGPERSRVYSDLNSEEKDRYNADIRATNILLQGLPKDIYTLINHYTDAKDILDNVKMLLEGSELTKEDRESQLYDDFEHFRQHKGESIHDYYVRFAKLINDMRNIKITMSKLQLNSKFVNNMLPAWGRFVTAVKLNRGLRDSNYDQLYAYLKKHETHAKENKMMLEHFSQPTMDPLALLSNVSNPQHYSPPSSASSSTQNVQGRFNRGQGMNPRGGSVAGYGGAQNRVGNVNQGQARPCQARTVKCYNCNGTGHIARNCTQSKRPQNSDYYKDKMLLMQEQENGVALDAEQLLFFAGGHDNAFDDDVDEQPVQDLALNVDNVFQANDCDAFDSDVDKAPTTQTMFMANLSSADPVADEAGPSYDSDILSEVPDHELYQDTACAHHEGHVTYDNVQLDHVVDSHADYMIDSNMIPYDQPSPYHNELNKVALGYKNPLCITRAKQIQPALYNGHEIIKENHTPAIVHNAEDTLEIAEITGKKMNAKMNDPESLKERTKVSRPIKAFIVYSPNTPATLVPKVHPTKSQVKIHIFTLILLFSEFDKTCKKRITPTGLTEGERGFKQTKACYLKEVIPFFNTLKDNFEGIQKALTKEIKEMKDVFEEMEAEVAQYVVDRKHDANERKNLVIANDNLIAECLSQEVKDKVKPQVLIRAKHAIDVEPIVPRLRNNRDAYLDYLRHLKESVETIRGIIEEAKVLAHIPLIRKKQVTIAKPSDKQDSHTHIHVATVKPQKTNVPVAPSTGVKSCPKASGSRPKSNPKTNKISPAKGVDKLPVEDQPKTNKSHLRTTNRVDSSSRLKRTVINLNSDSICQTCNKCLTSFDHDMCVETYLKSAVAPPSIRHNCKVVQKVKQVWKPKQVRQVWKPTRKVLTTIGYQWRPTGRILNLGKQCPLTRFTPPKVVSATQNKKQANKMADMTAPSGQAPAVALPISTDEEIVPRNRWVQIGKSNCWPLLLPPPFHQYTSSSSKIHFNMTRKLEATSVSWMNSADVLVKFVNQLGYPKLVSNVSNIVTNDMFQPWRALTTIINLCLTEKTSGFERPKAPVLQILWGSVTQSNIDYTERIWEEFTQSIYTFIEDKQNLSRHTTGKKRATLIVIPSIRFTKLIIHHLQMRHKFHPRLDSPLYLPDEELVLGYLKFSAKGTKREVFRMSIPGILITADIREASYYQEYQANVAKHKSFMAGETGSTQDSPAPKPAKATKQPKSTARKAPPRPSISTPVTSTQPAPTSAPAKPQEKKRKQATEMSDKPSKAKKPKHIRVTKIHSQKSVDASKAEEVPTVEPQVADEDADYQKALEESMKKAYALPRGPLPLVVIREPELGKYQPLPEVPGKGKAKVTEERISEPTGSSLHDESPYAVLGQSDSEEESKKEVLGATEGGNDEDQAGPDFGAQVERQTGIDAGTLEEDRAGPDPGAQAEGQTGTDADLGNARDEEQSIASPVVLTESKCEHMDLDAADVPPQPSHEQLDEGFTAMVYPKVQENLNLTVDKPVLLEDPASSSGTLSFLQHLSKDFSFGDLFFSDKHSKAKNDKTTAKTKVESMVSVTLQQDMSSILPMTSQIIDLSSRPESPKMHQQFKATTTETTTTTTTTTTLPPPPTQQQSNAEAMMIKRIGKLEHIMANLIQVNKEMKERLDKHGARLYTLERLDIHQQVSKAVSEVVTEAIDWAMQAPLRTRFKDLLEANMKEILHQRMWESKSYKSHEDHMQLFEALEKSMNRDQSEELTQDLAEARKKKKKSRESPKMPSGSPPHQPPHPPLPAGPSGASRTPRASGSSQVPPSPPTPSSTNQETQLSDDEDIRSAHVPKVNLRQDWWKPLEEERPAMPKPAWSIPSSDAPTDDITIFIDWSCKRRGIIELKPQDLEGLAFEIVKVFHPDVIHLQYQMEECHKLLTDSVDDPILRHNVSKPLPLGGPPVRTHMRILSVIRIEVFSLYGYDYMKKIVLRRANLNEHVIAERDFRQRVEDFQLGIESYQTQLNLTKPQRDATGFEYKHDYTVIDSPRAVMF